MHCEICGLTHQHFLTYNNRLNAKCPRCKSLERHREVFSVLAGSGLLSKQPKLRKLLLVSMDPYYSVLKKFFDVTVLAYQEHQPNTVHGDLCYPPFLDSSFDVVIQVHVLEHIKNDRRATRAVHRILRKGGLYISNVPCRKDQPTVEFGKADPAMYGHWRLYGTGDYAKLLTECGFKQVSRNRSTFTAIG